MAAGEVVPHRQTVVETRADDDTGGVNAVEVLAATANIMPMSFKARTIFGRFEDEEMRRSKKILLVVLLFFAVE
jgi:hypothetical protein